MKGLQGMHFASAVLLHIKDSLSRGKTCGHGGDVGDFALDRRLAQIAVVIGAVLAYRSVDDHLDLAVGDQIQNVRAALGELFHQFDRNAGLTDQSGSACSSDQGETCLMEGFSQRIVKLPLNRPNIKSAIPPKARNCEACTLLICGSISVT